MSDVREDLCDAIVVGGTAVIECLAEEDKLCHFPYNALQHIIEMLTAGLKAAY